jgi:alcohol dehydrogenase class IV
MKKFNYFQPTEIVYGEGKLNELADLVNRFGSRCLLVTTPGGQGLDILFDRVKKILCDRGMDVAHYDGVLPNPTTEVITKGAEEAKKIAPDVVIGLGGGSSMDSAKAIAVEATHEGSCWDYLYYKKEPTEKTLPVIAVSTTSGTGSQVTQVAVVTNEESRNKSALFHWRLYPRVALVDPELMVTVPKYVTATTGFDVFCHSFESTVHINNNPLVDTFAWKAIKIVLNTLPDLLMDIENKEKRAKMAFADILAGLSIANVGVTLPHGIGMAISGLYPQIAHGASLAINYPAFTRFTYKYKIPQFAKLARLLDPSLTSASDQESAERSCELLDEFLKSIDLWIRLKDYDMPEDEISLLAKNSMILPDYKNNPRVATEEEMLDLIKTSYDHD